MKNVHLSDFDIQRFAFELSDCKAEIVTHIHTCERCKQKADSYRSISDGIKVQPEPVLDFDLSALVLEQLPSLSKKESAYTYFIYFLMALSTLVVVAAILYFKEAIVGLFANTNTAAVPTSFIVSTCLLILTVIGIDTIRSFHKKMNLLNY